MAKADKVEVKGRSMAVVEGKSVTPGRNRVWHLDRDANDPRRVPAAKTGFSLNDDDPEKEPEAQNAL